MATEKVFRKIIEGRKYEYVAYCDKCNAGLNYKYDGSQLERRSNFYIAPISFYADTDELEQQEAKAVENETIDRIRQIAEQKQIY